MTNILYTDKQKNEVLYPTRREVLKELNKRGGLDQNLTDEYNRLEAGYKGEQLVYNYIKEFGQSHWTVMPNVWLDYYGKFEIDLLLITDNHIYIFEIKHFSGVYEFKNNQCIRNGQKIGHNAISQAQKSFINVQNLFKRNKFKQHVHGAVVFTGEHFDVKVHDEVDGLNILMINQLREYIWQISNTERQNLYKNTDAYDILDLLNQHAATNPFQANKITAEIDNRMKKGIICSNCYTPNIYTLQSYLECRCGMSEPRENAIIRTICEYGIIHFDKNLTTYAILDFFDDEIERRTAIRHLKKYFKQIGTGKGTQYENIHQSFWAAYNNFGLKRSRYYRC